MTVEEAVYKAKNQVVARLEVTDGLIGELVELQKLSLGVQRQLMEEMRSIERVAFYLSTCLLFLLFLTR